MTVRDVLMSVTPGRLPRPEAHMLLQHVLGVSRAWLIAHDHDLVPPESQARFDDLASQRLAGRPMAYLLGTREFMGHSFSVSDAVLIPRPDTELLVETAIQYLNNRASFTLGQQLPPSSPEKETAAQLSSDRGVVRVLDLGTGSGVVAISIALACPQAMVIATDISRDALELARHNARRLGARVGFLCGNWYDALSGIGAESSSSLGVQGAGCIPQPVVPVAGGGAFDLIVSNPPYIALGDPHMGHGDLRFEPADALTDGADGMQALCAVVHGATERLRPGGELWVEHGWDQGAKVRALLKLAGFRGVRSLPDLAGIDRISGGRWAL